MSKAPMYTYHDGFYEYSARYANASVTRFGKRIKLYAVCRRRLDGGKNWCLFTNEAQHESLEDAYDELNDMAKGYKWTPILH